MPHFRDDILAVFGQPVDDNPSAPMNEAALRGLGFNWRYLTLDIPPERLAGAVKGARALGMRGFNVTQPHKQSFEPLRIREGHIAGDPRVLSVLLLIGMMVLYFIFR